MNVAVSRDGRQAAVDRFDATPGIWLLDSARAGTRITFGGLYESTPVWSPDATAFAFAAARNGPPSLYLQKVGAASEGDHLYGTASQTLFPQSWSHDGRFLAFASMDRQTEVDIWLLALTGERKPVPFLRTRFSETHARISPDGRWLAYVSDDTGRPSVYVTRFPEPGGKWLVSAAGGNFPVWRHDSRELYYRAFDGKLVAVPIGSGADFTHGEPVPLFEPRAAIGDLGFGTFYDVAPDGRFLINILVERTSPPVAVVLNWRADDQSPPR
jgi:dipeptidyl aminopeptidase/acylaminoacyl peptidase